MKPHEMGTVFVHTNIIARDWRRLVDFYVAVFGCVPEPPQRSQSGPWLERGTGVRGAALEGMHLRLPGSGNEGPTLEIYTYSELQERPAVAANRLGFGHIAFRVDDVDAMLQRVLRHGGAALGKIAHAEITGKGKLTFVYALDPEENILELQHWEES